MSKITRYWISALGVMLLGLTVSCQTQPVPMPSLPESPTVITVSPKPSLELSSTPSFTNTPATLTPTEGVFPSPTYPPTETSIPASWKTYNLPETGVSLRYPEHWLAESPQRYGGQDGFFELSTRNYAVTVFGTLRTICTLEANLHKPDLYGEYPLVFDWQGWSPELQSWLGSGCGVLPSPDAPNSSEAVLFTRYTSDPDSNQVLVLRADTIHFTRLVSTLRMTAYATPTSSSGVYTSPLCTLSLATPLPEVSQFAGLTITEYPIVDAACHPYNHFDSFPRVHSLDLKMDYDWLNRSDVRRADESNQIQVGQDLIAWEFEQNHLFPVGASSQLNVLRNGQVIYTLAIPQMDPGGGPVKALWSWGNHWILEVENVVIMDGEIQNQKLGYNEMFEWHLVNDLPFYFFRQADHFGIVYDGETLPQRYDELIHGFLCCDPSLYSLQSTSSGAQFYARRDGTWWYVVVEAP